MLAHHIRLRSIDCVICVCEEFKHKPHREEEQRGKKEHDRDEKRWTRTHVDAEHRVFLGSVPKPDHIGHAAAADDIEHHHVLGQLDRIVEVEQERADHDGHGGRAGRDRRGQHDGGRQVAVGRRVVFGDQRRDATVRLSPRGHVDRGAIEVGGRGAAGGGTHVEAQHEHAGHVDTARWVRWPAAARCSAPRHPHFATRSNASRDLTASVAQQCERQLVAIVVQVEELAAFDGRERTSDLVVGLALELHAHDHVAHVS